MGLLVLSAVAALALTLLTLVTVLVVKLVLLVTVPNTVLLLLLVGAAYLEQSRRSCIAKGYYSCTQLPSADAVAAGERVPAPAQERKEEREEPKVEATPPKLNRATSVSSTESEEELDDSEPLATSANTETPAAAEAPRSGGRLPELRRQRLTSPSKSFNDSTKRAPSRLRRTTGSFPAHHGKTPHYINRDPIAAERKQMKAALETEGYWIGDFRTQQPSFARRSKQPVSPANAMAPPPALLHGRTAGSSRTRLVPHAV